jgi:hypothetical protein
VTRYQDKFHESGVAAQVDRIRDTISRFDEATHAAADSIRNAEKHYMEGTLAHADASAIFDAASVIAPHAPGVVTLRADLDGLLYHMQSAPGASQ